MSSINFIQTETKMSNIISCIPSDNTGNKLWIKDFRQTNGKLYIKYKSTYNDIPFTEVEIFAVDGGQNLVITGDDGTILFRFSANWINTLIDSSLNN